MGTVWQDVRFAARMLARAPGFTLVVVLVLGLGIGANTAIFSVVNAVVLRPLPFDDPDRIVQVLTQFEDSRFRQVFGGAGPTLCLLDFDQVRQRNHVFERTAAVEPAYFLDCSREEPRKVLGAKVSATFFSLLGVRPALGRDFRPEEDQPGQDQVVILSHQYWKERYGADPGTIGQNITFKEGVFTVIGVLPACLRFLEYGELSQVFSMVAEESEPRDIDLWKPLAPTAEELGPGSLHSFNDTVIARLRPGTTLRQARAELSVISKQLGQEYPRSLPRSLLPITVSQRTSAKVRPVLWVLLGTVATVLLIACANVANLLLARSLGRQREIAIRTALGAGRWRLVRQFLTESTLLSVLGGLCALPLTVWSLGLLRVSLLSKMPRLSDIRVDGWVLCFALGVALLAGAGIGLAPILRLPELSMGRALKEGRPLHGVLHRILLVSQVALTLMLLIGAGLMIKSFWRLTTVDLGFDPRNVLTLDAKYDVSLQERLEQLPGVQQVAFGEPCVWPGGMREKFDVVGRKVAVDGEYPEAKFVKIGAGYFATLRIPLLMGRSFTKEDHADAERVAIINQTIARRYFPDTSPIGQVLTCKKGVKSFRVVGVVGDVRPNGFRSDVMPTIYLPFVQVDWFSVNNNLLIRTAGDPEAVYAAVRREFAALNPLSAPPRIWTLEEQLASPTRPMRSNMQLLSLFGALALVLASAGVYGLMAFFVSQRTQEIGIRMALGAGSVDVLKSVVGQGLRLALVGIGLGLAGALGLTRVLASLLYDVSPTDPLTFACVSLVLLGVAALASYLPARRAARTDPMVALRYE
jgi:putative ABC transport system permease protein